MGKMVLDERGFFARVPPRAKMHLKNSLKCPDLENQ